MAASLAFLPLPTACIVVVLLITFWFAGRLRIESTQVSGSGMILLACVAAVAVLTMFGHAPVL
jgi:hypothetical protein